MLESSRFLVTEEYKEKDLVTMKTVKKKKKRVRLEKKKKRDTLALASKTW